MSSLNSSSFRFDASSYYLSLRCLSSRCSCSSMYYSIPASSYYILDISRKFYFVAFSCSSLFADNLLWYIDTSLYIFATYLVLFFNCSINSIFYLSIYLIYANLCDSSFSVMSFYVFIMFISFYIRTQSFYNIFNCSLLLLKLYSIVSKIFDKFYAPLSPIYGYRFLIFLTNLFTSFL